MIYSLLIAIALICSADGQEWIGVEGNDYLLLLDGVTANTVVGYGLDANDRVVVEDCVANSITGPTIIGLAGTSGTLCALRTTTAVAYPTTAATRTGTVTNTGTVVTGTPTYYYARSNDFTIDVTDDTPNAPLGVVDSDFVFGTGAPSQLDTFTAECNVPLANSFFTAQVNPDETTKADIVLTKSLTQEGLDSYASFTCRFDIGTSSSDIDHMWSTITINTPDARAFCSLNPTLTSGQSGTVGTVTFGRTDRGTRACTLVSTPAGAFDTTGEVTNCVGDVVQVAGTALTVSPVTLTTSYAGGTTFECTANVDGINNAPSCSSAPITGTADATGSSAAVAVLLNQPSIATDSESAVTYTLGSSAGSGDFAIYSYGGLYIKQSSVSTIASSTVTLTVTAADDATTPLTIDCPVIVEVARDANVKRCGSPFNIRFSIVVLTTLLFSVLKVLGFHGAP